MIATVTLNPSIDQHLLVRGLVKDDANRAHRIFRYPGGKGANVSKVAHELGAPTCAYALVGGFTGAYWKHLMQGLDIRYRAFPVKGDTRINTILTDLADGTQTRVSAPGPSVPAARTRAFLRVLLKVRPRPFLWVLGGSLPQGMPASTCRMFIEALQAAGTPCILDADGDALREGVRARPFLVKPNEFEMRRLAGRELCTAEEYFEAARNLVRRGVQNVIVSLGAEGALAVSRDEAFHLPGLDVPVKSKVGAGDSLIGGLAAGLWKGMTFREAARVGLAASASAVMREAPRLCRRRDIAGLVRRVRARDFGGSRGVLTASAGKV